MKLCMIVAKGMPKECPKNEYPWLNNMDTVDKTITMFCIFCHFVIQMIRDHIKHAHVLHYKDCVSTPTVNVHVLYQRPFQMQHMKA